MGSDAQQMGRQLQVTLVTCDGTITGSTSTKGDEQLVGVWLPLPHLLDDCMVHRPVKTNKFQEFSRTFEDLNCIFFKD